jgi:hypothetical protein
MATSHLDKSLAGTRWAMSQTATLSLTSPEKLGSFTIDAKVPAEGGELDLVDMTIALVLQVSRLDTGHFLMNAPMRAVIGNSLGAVAHWSAQAEAITVVSATSVQAAGDVVLGDNTLNIPATLELNRVADHRLLVAFTAQYVFPHVKLPVPGIPEQWDLPIDLAGNLTFDLATAE